MIGYIHDNCFLQALIDSTLVGLPQPMNIPGLSIGAGGNQMTPVLCLMNMVDIQELEDDDEYEGVLCQEYLIMYYLVVFIIMSPQWVCGHKVGIASVTTATKHI